MKLGRINIVLIVMLVIGIAVVVTLKMRQPIKGNLPRQGNVEKVGEVYTPYLSLDSTLYFIKHIDESIDYALATDMSEKAMLHFTFSNKRLLEMEKMVREGNFDYNPLLLASFLEHENSALMFTRATKEQGRDTERLMWLIQESAQDQQKVFAKILQDLPSDKKDLVMDYQIKSTKEIEEILNDYYGIK